MTQQGRLGPQASVVSNNISYNTCRSVDHQPISALPVCAEADPQPLLIIPLAPALIVYRVSPSLTILFVLLLLVLLAFGWSSIERRHGLRSTSLVRLGFLL